MRKHRLAERLLADVIGLDWEDVHIEACRWEHVMSEAVERRIVAMLTQPLVCPHGNPIPGLDEIGVTGSRAPPAGTLVTLTAASLAPGAVVIVDRISEQLQPDAADDAEPDRCRAAARAADERGPGQRRGRGLGRGEIDRSHRGRRGVSDHIFVRVA